MQYSVIFIGGSQDGHLQIIPKLEAQIVFPILKNHPLRFKGMENKIELMTEVYNLNQFKGDTIFYYYSVDGMQVDDVIERLFVTYNSYIMEKCKANFAS